MRYAIFSDIHSNLEAYQAFLKDCDKEKIDSYFCVGDIVGYGADPYECIEITKSLGCPVVCGNHDRAVISRLDIEYFNEYAKEAIGWTTQALSDKEKGYLDSLNLVYSNQEITLTHGDLRSPADFNYVMTIYDAMLNLYLQKTQFCFIGHSHVPMIFAEAKNKIVSYSTSSLANTDKNSKYLVNVGSIGQPRDGDWRASYFIYDNEKEELYIKRLEYDVNKTKDKILKAGLPSALAERLAYGR